MQIKYLRHLLVTVKPNTQLHIICRCRIKNANSTISSHSPGSRLPASAYAATIARTRMYYNLDELLHHGVTDGICTLECQRASARNLPSPPPPVPTVPILPWFISLINDYFTKERLTRLIKTKGKVEFITRWRQHQYPKHSVKHDFSIKV